MLNALLLAAMVSTDPAPVASPLKTIIRVKTSPMCTTIRQNVLNVLNGLQANDGLVSASKPVLLHMGKDFQPVGIEGGLADANSQHLSGVATMPGGVHDTNPALILDNQHLKQYVNELAHNLALLDNLLADPTKFPAQATSDDDKQTQLLRAQLQAVADQQRRTLGVLAGLADTFSMQDLIAKGDGTQGVLNGPNGTTTADTNGVPQNIPTVSHDDQDVSFKDPITASARENANSPKDPTVDKDPAISQRGTDLSNNPMARFYVGVTASQQRTGAAEEALGKTLQDVVASCQQ